MYFLRTNKGNYRSVHNLRSLERWQTFFGKEVRNPLLFSPIFLLANQSAPFGQMIVALDQSERSILQPTNQKPSRKPSSRCAYHYYSWPEIAHNATAHARGYMAIWPPYALRKRMADVKENENRTTSGLPGTSAVIRSSSWKLSRQSLLVSFCQHLPLALLFMEDYFRSLAHTTLSMTEAQNPIFCIPTRFWCAVA